jgi:CHAT domain-containing protein
MDFTDYNLMITDGLEIAASSPGSITVTDKFLIDKKEIVYAVTELEKEEENVDSIFLKNVGTQLANSLFTPKIKRHFSEVRSKNPGKGLRIRLRIESAEILAYPWEALFLDNKYLALSIETPLTRSFSYEKSTRKDFSKPIKILIIGSNPSAINLPAVQVNREIENITDALKEEVKSGFIKLDVLPIGSIKRIMDQLDVEQYNIIHFIGHGVFKDGLGYLALESSQGDLILADHDWIGKIFQNQISLGLVILNACQGAKLSTDKAFTGLASEFIKLGIPSVIAMRYSITNPTARLFSKEFYKNMLKMPIDENLQRVRNRLYVEETSSAKDFITPILFMNTPDGLVFNPTDEISRELMQAPECSTRIKELKEKWKALYQQTYAIDERDFWLLICEIYEECGTSLDERTKRKIREMQTIVPVLLKAMDDAMAMDFDAKVQSKIKALRLNYQRLIDVFG